MLDAIAAGNQVVDLQAAAIDALGDVLRRAHRAGHDVHVRLETHAAHADRMADVFLTVDDVFLRLLVEHALVGRNRHGAGGVEHVIDVGLA